VTNNNIWLLSLGWRKALRSRTLGTTPIALSDKECAPYRSGITFSSLLINNILLGFYHTACFAFIIDANYFGAELEGSSFGCWGEGFEEGDEALAVDYTTTVEFGNTGDGDGALGGVEVNYFLAGMFKC
jgi:hypothetical protein